MPPPRRDAVVATLRQRFLSASHLGLLAPGDKLPSARDLARELGVDRRVVFAAYRALEREGVIALRQRSGIYFAPAAADAQTGAASGRAAQHAAAQRVAWLAGVVADGVGRGTPVPALADELHRHVGTLRLRAACLECNDDQIAALCATLGGDYGFEASGVLIDPLRDVTASFPALFPPSAADPGIAAREPGDASPADALPNDECRADGGRAGRWDTAVSGDPPARPAAPPADLPAALRRADLLVTTPFHAGDVKLVAERLGKPWIAVELRADVYGELARLLAAGPAYAVVADPRFAYKLGLIYQAFRDASGAPRFRALVAGRDALTAIPARAPTLVTGLAREQLAITRRGRDGEDDPASASAPLRELAEPRALSATSARELAGFIVQANAAALGRRIP